MKPLLRSREALVTLLLVLLVVVTGLFNPNFFKPDSIVEIFNASLTLVLISLGEMFVILTRGIDVSVGATAGLAAVVLGTTLNLGWPVGAAALAAVAAGTLAGALNAFGVTFLRVPPIIMTLGTLGIYRGLMRIITGGSWIENLPQSIKEPNLWSFLGVPFFVWLTLALLALTAFVTLRVRLARYFYAVGDNEAGAYLLGLPVRWTQFAAYTLAGTFAALAAIVFTSQIGFVSMNAADGFELKAIAANVLGGVSLTGGVGTPVGAAIGALFLTAVHSMLIFLGVPGIWDNAFAGIILLIVVYVDYRVRSALELQRRQARIRGDAGGGA
ncbi:MULTISPECIES: ATPase [Oceanithermus]|uniref:Autoinducer 2 import system permease protein LsrC n=2 Tax=Oceanithermus desulfurans TaxID=227924 RepID=A0A511RIC8_9DEIN|nr:MULTISPECIES: ATPase [Oceanithermus]MBB6030305.1 AI-2 transport system permease protein [Oceanithermus desulfurans]GEM89394.1 autoinducer 2 ABC transporter permease LsrC [Oceanithermus desulfurans NBRC 100063]